MHFSQPGSTYIMHDSWAKHFQGSWETNIASKSIATTTEDSVLNILHRLRVGKPPMLDLEGS